MGREPKKHWILTEAGVDVGCWTGTESVAATYPKPGQSHRLASGSHCGVCHFPLNASGALATVEEMIAAAKTAKMDDAKQKHWIIVRGAGGVDIGCCADVAAREMRLKPGLWLRPAGGPACEACGMPLDEQGRGRRIERSIDDLIAASSLGSVGAQAVRERAPKAEVDRILARVAELDAAQAAGRPLPDLPNDDEETLAVMLDDYATTCETTGGIDGGDEAAEAARDLLARMAKAGGALRMSAVDRIAAADLLEDYAKTWDADPRVPGSVGMARRAREIRDRVNADVGVMVLLPVAHWRHLSIMLDDYAETCERIAGGSAGEKQAVAARQATMAREIIRRIERDACRS